MMQSNPKPGRYTGAAWNELMANESKETLAELLLDVLRENREMRKDIRHLRSPFMDAQLNTVDTPLEDMPNEQYARYCDYSASCPCQRCWETGYVLRLRYALDRAIDLQTHYAEELNKQDGGSRRLFASGMEWYQQLVKDGALSPGGVGCKVRGDEDEEDEEEEVA